MYNHITKQQPYKKIAAATTKYSLVQPLHTAVKPSHSRGSVLPSTEPRLYSRGSCFPARTQNHEKSDLRTYIRPNIFYEHFTNTCSRTYVREHAEHTNICSHEHTFANMQKCCNLWPKRCPKEGATRAIRK